MTWPKPPSTWPCSASRTFTVVESTVWRRKGLTGLNYISLFFGDAQAQPTADLTRSEITTINGELRKLARLMGGHRP